MFKNDFWKETLLTYSELKSEFICDKNEDILSSSLWYNDNIKIDNTVLPLLRGHPFCRAKVASQEGWPLVRGKGLRESEG